MSRIFAGVLSICMDEPFASFNGDFASPQSRSVEAAEAVHHDWNWECDAEGAKHSANATDEFAKSSIGSNRTLNVSQH